MMIHVVVFTSGMVIGAALMKLALMFLDRRRV